MQGRTVSGKSIENRPITWHLFSPYGRAQTNKIWLIAGTHGDEWEGIWAIRNILNLWKNNYPMKNVSVSVCAEINPDGVFHRRRWNMNSVDLNRNLPTKDWTSEIKNPRYPPGPKSLSEPESQALINQFEKDRPIAILNLHSFWNFQVNVNASEKIKKDSRVWAQRIAQHCHYPVTEDIGYPTPGCLGTYAGVERDIPSITFEFERGIPKNKVIKNFVPIIVDAIKFWDERIK